jgi:hypothetical protein
MNKSIAFAVLDWNLLKPYAKGMLIVLLLGVFMGVALDSPSMFSTFIIVQLMLVMTYPFSIGEKNGLDTLYGTLSLSRKNIVAGRYLFALVCEAVFLAAAVAGSWLLFKAFGGEFVIQNEIANACLMSCLFSLVSALQFPVYFKLGYTKAKVIALAPLMIVSMGLLQLPVLSKMFAFPFTSLAEHFTGNPLLRYVAPVVLGLAFMAASYQISCGIYTKRDM